MPTPSSLPQDPSLPRAFCMRHDACSLFCSNSNSNLYKPKWHRSQCCGQKCTRVRCARVKNVKESVCMGGRAMRLMCGRGVGECGSGRHSYGGGVISEVGWLSLCGAPPRGFCLAPRNLVVWVGESGSGRLFPRGGNSSWLGCCCGAGLRASEWRSRHRRGHGAVRLRQRVAP